MSGREGGGTDSGNGLFRFGGERRQTHELPSERQVRIPIMLLSLCHVVFIACAKYSRDFLHFFYSEFGEKHCSICVLINFVRFFHFSVRFLTRRLKSPSI